MGKVQGSIQETPMTQMSTVIEELWKVIPEFPIYSVSSFGRLYNNRTQRYLHPTKNNYGHLKVNLSLDGTSERFTRSVAKLVGEAFIKKPDPRCDFIVLLDGDFDHVAAANIV